MAFDWTTFAQQRASKTSTVFNWGDFAAGKIAPKKNDLGTVEGLRAEAEKAGLGKQAKAITEDTNKLSALQRLGKGLSAFNPAQAISVGQEKGLGAGLLEYPKSIISGVGSAITGKDYEPDRKYFADIADKMGVKNGIAKFGIGFAGDVLLDPTTYFGGAIAKGIVKTASVGTNVALKSVGKLAPEIETGLRMAGTGVQDAFGRAFVAGYKSSKGAMSDILSSMSDKSRKLAEAASEQLGTLGVKGLSKDQLLEVGLKSALGKQGEFLLGEKVSQNALETVNKLFPELKVKNPKHAEQILGELENITQKNVTDIRTKVDEIVKPYFDSRQTVIKSGKIIESKTGVQTTPALGSFSKVDDLNRVVDGLKKQLAQLRKGRKPIGQLGNETFQDLGGAITKEEAVNAHNSLIKYEEQRLSETIDDISKRIEALKNKPVNIKGVKTPVMDKLTPAETVIYGERLIKKLQNDLADKSRLLTTATKGRTTATKLIEEAQKTGDWSKVSAVDKELADKINVKFDTPQQQEYFLKQQARAKEFATMSGITDPYAVYFPFLKDEAVKKFTDGIQQTGIRVGSENYLKQFKNILTPENIKLNPIEAHFTREAQMISDIEARKTLKEFVEKYGKPITEFADESTAKQAGFKLLKEKGGFGKPVGYVGEWDYKLFNDLIRPEFQTISILAKATGFDAITSLFKRGVTGPFLPFHIRNLVSGGVQNFETSGWRTLLPQNINDGRKLAYYMGKGTIPKEIGEKIAEGTGMKFKDIFKATNDKFSGDTFYNADFIKESKRGSDVLLNQAKILSSSRLKETIKTVGLGQEAIPFKVGRIVGQFIEHQQKAIIVMTELRKGKTIQEALSLAERAGFDYRALTAFESQIMRRLIPFYSFTRKNIELQLKTLGENPERINQVIRFFSNIGEAIGGSLTEEEKKNLPDFIRESMGVKLQDTPEGLKQYISSFGTPIEAFAQLFGKNPILRAISMSNPILKLPTELGIGKDSFRQRDLQDVYTANEYDMAPQIIKDLLEIKEVQKPIYQTINGKAVKTGEKTAYIADPERLLIARSLFTSRGVSYLDQVFDNDMQGFIKVLKTTTGIKPQQVDIESQKYFNERDKQRALEDMLNRYGVVKKFEKSYIPKK